LAAPALSPLAILIATLILAGGLACGGGTPRCCGGDAGGGAGASVAGGAGTGGLGMSGTGGVAGTPWSCPAGPFTSPFPLAAAPARIAGVPPADAFNDNGSSFGIIEGPVWLGGALYVSEIGSTGAPPPSRILKIDAGGGVSIAIADAGSNGLAVGPGGELLTANHKFGAITAYSLPDGIATQIVGTFMGARFDSPNDLTRRGDGTIYFSDPDYQAPAARPQAETGVYRVAPGSSTALVVDDDRQEPNGITLSLDEKTLYVDGGDGLYSYPVNVDGSVGARTKLTQSIGASDGMAVDCQGNLYVATGATLAVVSPTGAALGTITLSGVQGATNAAFGGADHQTLYITALGTGPQMGLFALQMPLPGMPY
jgi:gluconolactonase